jgi:hypothetical protein
MARTSQTSRRSTGGNAIILTRLHVTRTRNFPEPLGIATVIPDARGIARASVPRTLALDDHRRSPASAVNPGRVEDEEVSKPFNLTICNKKLTTVSGAPCAPMVAG